jgi:HlyD family secretion protein
MDIVRAPSPYTRRTLLVGGGAVLIATAAAWVSALEPSAPTVRHAAILIDSVRRGDVLREVRGPGTLVPEQIRWITAQASARVERLVSESGRLVAAGDLLLELSNPDLQLQSLQAEQSVRQAESALLALRTSLRSQVLTQQGVVATTRTQFVGASQDASTAESLAVRNFISTVDAQNKRAFSAELTTRLRLEEERLRLMEEAIADQLNAQQGQIVQLKAIADNQRNRLRSLSVRAPERGVLQDLTLQLGQWVPEGTTLAKVVQPGRLKAVLRIPESQAKDVAIGQRATIDTRNGMVVGHVARKDPSAQSGTVIVDVMLDGALPSGAVPDLSIDGTIVVERLTNALHSGRPALASGAGETALFKLVDGGRAAIRVPVQLGRQSVNVIEIVRGLDVGDRIIVSDMSQYATVPRVRINQ